MNYLPFVIYLAILGLIASVDIFRRKRSKKKMKCAFGMQCDIVVKSKYGKTLGIGNEVYGMLYYIFIMGVISNYLTGQAVPETLIIATVLISFVAALASLYLVYIQNRVLKNYCFMCLMTAVINLLIFGLLLAQ